MIDSVDDTSSFGADTRESNRVFKIFSTGIAVIYVLSNEFQIERKAKTYILTIDLTAKIPSDLMMFRI